MDIWLTQPEAPIRDGGLHRTWQLGVNGSCLKTPSERTCKSAPGKFARQ